MTQSRWLFAVSLAVALIISACSAASPQASPSPAAGSSAAATPSTAPTKPTAAPSPTVAPTLVPTVAPTVAPTATEATQPTSTPAPQPAPGGPAVSQGDIRKMAEAFAAVKSYRAKITATGGQTNQTYNMDVEVVKPDRWHSKMVVGGQTIESYVIGPDVYTYFNGKWTKTTIRRTPTAQGGLGTFTSSDPSTTINQLNQSINQGEKLTKGTLATVNGTPCQEWVITSTTAGGSGTMCVGLASNLPLQFKSADGKVVMTFYDFNAPITINPPI